MSNQSQLKTQFGNVYANTTIENLLNDFYTKSQVDQKIEKEIENIIFSDSDEGEIEKLKINFDDLKSKFETFQENLTTLTQNINSKADQIHKHSTSDINEFETTIENNYINNISRRLTNIEQVITEINNKLNEII